MAKLDDVYGPDDEDVMNFRAGIAGLAFDGWSDEQISDVAIEEARAYRAELAEAINAATKKTKSDDS